MKKIAKLVILVMAVMLIGCGEVKTHDNGAPGYFLEPEGYVIAKVYIVSDSDIFSKFNYGYITEEDYQNYLDGTLTGVLIIKHPYEEGITVNMQAANIESIVTGVYKDLRGWD